MTTWPETNWPREEKWGLRTRQISKHDNLTKTVYPSVPPRENSLFFPFNKVGQFNKHYFCCLVRILFGENFQIHNFNRTSRCWYLSLQRVPSAFSVKRNVIQAFTYSWLVIAHPEPFFTLTKADFGTKRETWTKISFNVIRKLYRLPWTNFLAKFGSILNWFSILGIWVIKSTAHTLIFDWDFKKN